MNLSGRPDEVRIVPRSVEVAPGDVVQIVVLDRRTHLIRFDEERMDPAMREFLRESGQERFPPLLARGARLVLSFEGAPPGRYVFFGEGNGVVAEGEILVVRP